MSGPARESGQVNAWLGLLAVLTCVTLVLTALRPGLAVSLVIFAASAAFGAYRLGGQHRLRAPRAERAASAGVRHREHWIDRCQGAMLVAAGVAADLVTPAVVIAVAGGLGAVAALVLALSWRRVSLPGGRHAAVRRSAHAAARRSSVP